MVWGHQNGCDIRRGRFERRRLSCDLAQMHVYLCLCRWISHHPPALMLVLGFSHNKDELAAEARSE